MLMYELNLITVKLRTHAGQGKSMNYVECQGHWSKVKEEICKCCKEMTCFAVPFPEFARQGSFNEKGNVFI